MKLKFKPLLLLGVPVALACFAPPAAHAWTASATHALLAVQQEMTGRVLDAAGIPLAGVTVINLQTQASVQTASDGAFQIPVEKGQTLRFTYLGYATQQMTVDAQSELVIRSEPDNTALDEVVVVGYGTQKKANLTGAVDQVGPEVFEGRALANVSQMLQGAVPNLNISPADGKPTRAPGFNIRGTTSIGQGGSALILIDGVEGDPSVLNPNDIESVSVLKDASSAAIYGSRGTFGVVLITTKRAKDGRSSINYSGGLTSQKPTTLPDF